MNEAYKKGQGHDTILLKKKVRNNLKCRLHIPYVCFSAYSSMTKKNTTLLFYYFYVLSAIQQNTEYVCKKTGEETSSADVLQPPYKK